MSQAADPRPEPMTAGYERPPVSPDPDGQEYGQPQPPDGVPVGGYAQPYPYPLAPPARAEIPPELLAAADVVLRVIGALAALAGGVMSAALAVILIPLRLGSYGGLDGGAAAVRIPVSVVLAVAGSLFLVWFARNATGVRWAALLPGIGWFTTIVIAMRTTAEGDRLLVPDDWVGTLTLFGGTITLVIATVLAVTARGRPAGAKPAG